MASFGTLRALVVAVSVAIAGLCLAARAHAYIYWSNTGVSDTIERANLDGTGVNPSLVGGANFPVGVAVDSQHVYWANQDDGGGTIGRGNLDGSGVNQNFITFANTNTLLGVAVDGPAHLLDRRFKRVNRAR